MTSRSAALADLRRTLLEGGVESAALDARLLILGALGIGATELLLYPERPLTPVETQTVSGFAKRRLAHEPVARILGEREFWGLPFALSPETLVPRPDSETVVETALKLEGDPTRPVRIVDLGTGSGCLLVALLHEMPNARGLGIDRSADALRTARLNAIRNGVGGRSLFARADWGDALAGEIDLIVSNPPYIATAIIEGLDREVREHDPPKALDGGADGLDAYRTILTQTSSLLSPGGHLVLEIGYDQEDALRELASQTPLSVVATAKDLGGHPRCVALKRT